MPPNAIRDRRQFGDNAIADRVLFLGEKSATADRDALAKAKEMKAVGANDEEIYAATGWWQGGKTGRWSYEVSDERFKATKPLGKGRFFDHYTHPDLEGAYPELEQSTLVNTEVDPRLNGASGRAIPTPMSPGTGSYPPEYTTSDWVPPGTVLVNRKKKERDLTALHELQHIIDYYEGYKYEPRAPAGMSQAPYTMEARAKDVERRRRMSADERRRQLPWREGEPYPE